MSEFVMASGLRKIKQTVSFEKSICFL